MKKSIIVAAAENGAIGKDNDLIWHLPRDLRFFKKMTLGHTLLMGANTYEALGKPLPGRKHLVVSRSRNYQHEQVEMAQTVENAIARALEWGQEELFITGGGSIYRYCLEHNLVDKVYLSTVHGIFDADTFFEGFERSEWQLITSVHYEKDEKNAYALSFEQFAKKWN